MADFSQDQIRAELIKRGALPADEEPRNPGDNFLAKEGDNPFGFMSHPITNTMKAVHGAQDVAGGLAGSIQRLAATLGEAGQGIATKLTGGYAPRVNIREELGLEGDNPVDLRKIISHNPDSFLSTLGGFLPAIAAGGPSIGRQMIANGLWGAIQANPDEENLGGRLPSGRITAGIEDAALTGAGGAALKYAPGLIIKGAQQVGKALNYLNPNKDAAAFLKSLGAGTKEENVQALARDIQSAHEKNMAEALAHKEPIYKKEAGTDIYKIPDTALPEGNLEKVAHYIAPGEKYTPQQLQKLGEEIKAFRKHGDFDEFSQNAQEIFNADMHPLQVKNLETAMNIPTKGESKFLSLAESNSKIIEGNTKDLYQKFLRKPSLSNADALQSQLGDDWGYYDNLRKQGKLEPALKPRLKKLDDLRKALKEDMKEGLNRKNPAYEKELQQYTDKYRENVVPYGEENFTQNIVSEGKRVKEARKKNANLPFNVTQGEAASYFANPSRAALKVSEDIGEEGRKRILYNLLANEAQPEAKGLAAAIRAAKQSQGYSRYVTPEMEDLATALERRANWRRRARNALYGTAGLAGVVGAEELIRKYL